LLAEERGARAANEETDEEETDETFDWNQPFDNLPEEETDEDDGIFDWNQPFYNVAEEDDPFYIHNRLHAEQLQKWYDTLTKYQGWVDKSFPVWQAMENAKVLGWDDRDKIKDALKWGKNYKPASAAHLKFLESDGEPVVEEPVVEEPVVDPPSKFEVLPEEAVVPTGDLPVTAASDPFVAVAVPTRPMLSAGSTSTRTAGKWRPVPARRIPRGMACGATTWISSLIHHARPTGLPRVTCCKAARTAAMWNRGSPPTIRSNCATPGTRS
jgi:hypothetical protein